MGRETCCICKTWTSSKFVNSSSYEKKFVDCFGQEASNRSGKLCESCKGNLRQHEKSQDKTFFDKIDSRAGVKRPKHLEVKSKAHETTYNRWHATISNLPLEIWLKILSLVSAEDLSKFGATCRDAHGISEHPILWKSLFRRQHVAPILFDFGTDWKTVYIMVRLTSQKKSTLALQHKLEEFQGQLTDSEGENEKLNCTINRLQATLDFLSASSVTSAISPIEEKIFRNILRKKQTQASSSDGLITAKNSHGRPIYLQQVRHVEVPSNEASSRTIRERSRSGEVYLQVTSTKVSQNSENQLEAKTVQATSNIKRNKKLYSNSAEKAGLKIFGTFSESQAASLKRELSFQQWRAVKRLLVDVSGRDVVGSEKKLRQFLQQNCNFEYETGSFESNQGKCVTFLRIKDLASVVNQTAKSLNDVDELRNIDNVPRDTLSLLTCADKGSTQTKLVATILNSERQHSINRAKLLAIFEGEKDTRECVEKLSKNYACRQFDHLKLFP